MPVSSQGEKNGKWKNRKQNNATFEKNNKLKNKNWQILKQHYSRSQVLSQIQLSQIQ